VDASGDVCGLACVCTDGGSRSVSGLPNRHGKISTDFRATMDVNESGQSSLRLFDRKGKVHFVVAGGESGPLWSVCDLHGDPFFCGDDGNPEYLKVDEDGCAIRGRL
jgi:hypothetical protein